MEAVIRFRLLAPLERGHPRFPSPFVRVNGAAYRPRAESILMEGCLQEVFSKFDLDWEFWRDSTVFWGSYLVG